MDAPSIPGGVQGQVGWGPGQPGLVLGMEVGGLLQQEGLELDDPWHPFQPKPFYDSMTLSLCLCSKQEFKVSWSTALMHNKVSREHGF